MGNFLHLGNTPFNQYLNFLHLGNKTHYSINIYKFFTYFKLNLSTQYMYIYILPLCGQSNHVEHEMILISFIHSTV